MLKRVLAAISIVAVASCQDNGSLSVHVADANHVAVDLAGAPPSQYILLTRDKADGTAERYFVGNIRDGIPSTLKLDLPKDFALFDHVETGPTFNPTTFPSGKYGVSFYINAEHAYLRDFEIAAAHGK